MTDEKKESRSDDEQLFTELRRLSPKVTGGLRQMRQEVYRNAAVSAKYKLLTAMAISIAIRCEPCIRAYVRLTYDGGVSQDEFIEVAMTMQGCPGEEWALKAYAFFKEITPGQTNGQEDETCCQIH
ncbi:MAG: carboxymuconolactone decarboxylase family protein [Gaiellales bacterium]|nr:MAG: carboxymuconolactone decarboxylase family protein [Gaiellales bacterium]